MRSKKFKWQIRLLQLFLNNTLVQKKENKVLISELNIVGVKWWHYMAYYIDYCEVLIVEIQTLALFQPRTSPIEGGLGFLYYFILFVQNDNETM